MWENLEGYEIILASNSPRRRELLAGLNVPFSVRTLDDIDETYPEALTCKEVPEYLSKKKAAAYADLIKPNTLLITADTIVCLDGEVLGKPADEEEAFDMLSRMAGQTHTVVTAVSIVTAESIQTFSAESEVKFAPLCAEEIRYYLSHYKPYDKAGAYGIQEWIGMAAIEYINGSFYNVMGLPVQRLYKRLRAIPAFRQK